MRPLPSACKLNADSRLACGPLSSKRRGGSQGRLLSSHALEFGLEKVARSPVPNHFKGNCFQRSNRLGITRQRRLGVAAEGEALIHTHTFTHRDITVFSLGFTTKHQGSGAEGIKN